MTKAPSATRRWRGSAAALALVVAALTPVAAHAQGDRAIELVTPPHSSVDVKLGGGAATPDGNVACFNSETAILDAPSNGIDTADDGYCAWRTADGWQSKWVTGPEPLTDPRGWGGSQVYFLSDDGQRVAFASDQGIVPDFAGVDPGGSVFATLSAFMWEGGQTRWLAPSPAPIPEFRPPGTNAIFVQREPLAASADLRHGLFVSNLAVVPQDANGTLDLYEWTPSGVRLVTRAADGSAVGGWAGGLENDQTMPAPGSISRDGSRIFFEHTGTALEGAPADVQSVFMRQGDELTLVSPRRGPGPAADVFFAGATADGAVAYLLSAEQLTDEPKQAGRALYEYDVAGDELSLIATHADGVEFLGASGGDGSTVLYRSAGTPSQLLVSHDGVEASLGALEFQDTASAFDAVASPRADKRGLRMSADGETIVFASYGAFGGVAAGIKQVYVWTPADGVRRISRDSEDSAPSSSADIGNFSAGIPGPRMSLMNTLRQRPNLGRVMSGDGSRIFFETADPLVADDVNGFIDVYEWRDGGLSLVSPGTQGTDAFYHDSSADGGTVFVATRAPLIPQLDRNSSFDLYAAREGGGFPLPPPPPDCEGEACQGAPPALPTGQPPATKGFQGSADAPPSALRVSVGNLTRAQRKALIRRGKTTLRVRASKRGTVTAVARAKLAGRMRVVARASRVARGGTSTGLPLKLSKRARSALKTRRGLRLVIMVSHSGSETTVRREVMLRG